MTATDSRLKNYVDRLERIQGEKAALTEDEKEILKEAKDEGYDTAKIRRLVKLRNMDDDERRADELTENSYRAQVGIKEFAE